MNHDSTVVAHDEEKQLGMEQTPKLQPINSKARRQYQQQQQTSEGLQTDLAERTISNTDAPIPHHEADDAFNPPDRGWRAWSQVLAATLLNCIVWGYPSSFGVFQLYYVEEMGLPNAQVSWIGSIQIFLTFAMCSISGRLADAGLARWTVAVGSFLVVLGTFMVSLATEYWQILLAQGVCAGMGAGIAFMPAVAVMSSYFKKNRAFALACAATGTSWGSLIFPSIVQYLIPQVGFAWAVRCEAFVAVVICVISNLLLRPYLPPRKSGPLLEWDAFKELPYVLFTFGGFLNLYVLFFGFFYVSPDPHSPSTSNCFSNVKSGIG